MLTFFSKLLRSASDKFDAIVEQKVEDTKYKITRVTKEENAKIYQDYGAMLEQLKKELDESKKQKIQLLVTLQNQTRKRSEYNINYVNQRVISNTHKKKLVTNPLSINT